MTLYLKFIYDNKKIWLWQSKLSTYLWFHSYVFIFHLMHKFLSSLKSFHLGWKFQTMNEVIEIDNMVTFPSLKRRQNFCKHENNLMEKEKLHKDKLNNQRNSLCVHSKCMRRSKIILWLTKCKELSCTPLIKM